MAHTVDVLCSESFLIIGGKLVQKLFRWHEHAQLVGHEINLPDVLPHTEVELTTACGRIEPITPAPRGQ